MPVYSHTQLSIFEQCPQRYKFQYIDKIPKSWEQSIEAFVGSRVHEALQKLYDDLRCGKLHSLDSVLAYYQEQWRGNWSEGIRIFREGFSETDYRDYGSRGIENYYRRYHPFSQSQTLKTEFHLLLDVDGRENCKFQGYIDRLDRREDGVYEIHDYKTGANLPTQRNVDADRQLALYQIGLERCWNDVKRVDLVWHFLGFDVTLVSHRSPTELLELSKQTAARISEIETCRDFPPVKSALCDWCEYRAQCPAWKHVIAVKAMPPEAVAADQGVRLANEYAAVKREIDSLQERFAKIRNEVLEYLRQQRLTGLQGNGVRLSVTSREEPALPARSEAAWGELEQLVRSAGKWDEASELSAKKLLKMIREGDGPPALIEGLRKFIHARSVTTLRLSPCDLPKNADEAE
jgi:putative RecB family exonuclease